MDLATGTIKWNRTNPWWTPSSGVMTKEFRYPLTCCPMNKTHDNRNSFTIDQLKQATNCALYGTNIYDVVSLIYY